MAPANTAVDAAVAVDASPPDAGAEHEDGSTYVPDGGSTYIPDGGNSSILSLSCAPEHIQAGDGCDCSCGVVDPDCDGSEVCDRAPVPDLVSISSTGVQGDEWSLGSGAVSDDGRYVAFASVATNLEPGFEPTGGWSVFVRDRVLGTTRRLSYGADVSMSADGRYIAYGGVPPGDTVNEDGGCMVYDQLLGTSERAGSMLLGGPDDSRACQISSDGQRVVFFAATPVSANTTSMESGVYLYDRNTRETKLVSKDENGNAFNDARFGSISPDGKFVVFGAENALTNYHTPIYLYDVDAGTSVLVSVSKNGMPVEGFDATVASGGRFVVFASSADDIVDDDIKGAPDVFVRDTETATTRLLGSLPSAARNVAFMRKPFISSDGQRVIFNAVVDRPFPADGFVMAWDAAQDASYILSLNRDARPISLAQALAISANGRWAVFDSDSSDLVPGDNNNQIDIFVTPVEYRQPVTPL